MLVNIFLRTIMIYFVTLIAIRIMGKREVGELSPFDLVVSIMIAELGVIAIEDGEKPLLASIIPIFTLVGIEVLISFLAMKSIYLRRIISGVPNILIKNGNIKKEELYKSRYNIHDLLSQLRKKDIFNVKDVEFAILETSGDLSVIPKSQKRPVTPQDLNLETEYEGLAINLIIDGEIIYDTLDKIGLTKKDLKKKLLENGFESEKNILLATIDTQGEFYFCQK